MEFDIDDRYTRFTNVTHFQREKIGKWLFSRVHSIDNLVAQRMPSAIYKIYSNWHQANSRDLRASIGTPIEFTDVKINCSHIAHCKSTKLEKVPYDTSTLGESGCGPACVAQAIGEDVKTVADIFAKKGYYYKGNGTWRMALNRLGAKECSHIREISEALRSKKIVTILGNGHFRNIIGVFQGYFVIADSSYDKIRFEKIEETFEKTKCAWVWPNS